MPYRRPARLSIFLIATLGSLNFAAVKAAAPPVPKTPEPFPRIAARASFDDAESRALIDAVRAELEISEFEANFLARAFASIRNNDAPENRCNFLLSLAEIMGGRYSGDAAREIARRAFDDFSAIGATRGNMISRSQFFARCAQTAAAVGAPELAAAAMEKIEDPSQRLKAVCELSAAFEPSVAAEMLATAIRAHRPTSPALLILTAQAYAKIGQREVARERLAALQRDAEREPELSRKRIRSSRIASAYADSDFLEESLAIFESTLADALSISIETGTEEELVRAYAIAAKSIALAQHRQNIDPVATLANASTTVSRFEYSAEPLAWLAEAALDIGLPDLASDTIRAAAAKLAKMPATYRERPARSAVCRVLSRTGDLPAAYAIVENFTGYEANSLLDEIAIGSALAGNLESAFKAVQQMAGKRENQAFVPIARAANGLPPSERRDILARLEALYFTAEDDYADASFRVAILKSGLLSNL